MKKIIIASFIVILVPYFVVTFFVKEIKVKEEQKKELKVRVKKVNGEITNILFEEYIVGVLAGEMPANFEIEALKAQAVAARSYVLKKMENNNKEYDILDTVMNQVYLDEKTLKEKWKDKYNEKIDKIKKAVNETSGKYLTYDNKIVEAFFFSTSTGKTENVEEVFSEKLPYLRSVDSSWDEEVSPVFNETKTFDLKTFFNKLGIEDTNDFFVEILETTSTGRIKKIKINNKEFKGTDIATLLELKSNYFKITKLENNVLITTKGYGHGVGMSQYGSQAMAKKGYKYDQILKYYYQNVEIQNM